MSDVRTTVVMYDTQISEAEIGCLRGLMISVAGGNSLFHNHQGEGYRYAYPLVQYKRIAGHAALVGIGEGADAVAQLAFDHPKVEGRIGRRQVEMSVANMRMESSDISCGGEMDRRYKVSRWMPLNEKNYHAYRSTQGLIERMAMMERLLTANILSFAKGVGVFFDREVRNSLTRLVVAGHAMRKGVEMMAFDAEFASNVEMPDYVGIGKGASIGRGTLMRRRI